jgi:sugar phosphate isomerase/epimerase
MKKTERTSPLQLCATNLRCSRRRFLMLTGTAAAGVAAHELLGAERNADNIHLGMMLQGNSAAELQLRAKAVAAAGFERVQVSFFFAPAKEDLESLAQTLTELKLKTVAFGTYFNPLRPDDTRFMGSCQAAMKQVAAHAALFDCKQFVTWSGSFSASFDGTEARNHTPDAIREAQRAIREVLLPILAPIGGRVALEPYYKHILGTIEAAESLLAPFPAEEVGIVLDPPNFISPAFYPKREEEMRRLFRTLGKRIHLGHFKDLKLNATGQNVDLPGPGGGVMNYKLLTSQIRSLKRPLPCIIEHIDAETATMQKTKSWVEDQIRMR